MTHATVTDAADVAARLGVDAATGLDPQEAATRLATDGSNELRGTATTPAWLRFLSHFNDPVIYLLLAAVAVAIAAWWVEGATGVPVDAIVIGAVVLLNSVIGYAQEARAADAVAALSAITQVTSTVVRGGRRVSISSAELVRGDILVLSEGDAVGADARLVRADTLRVAEASLTGESEAVLKSSDTLDSVPALGDRTNMVFKGTAVVQGSGLAIVTDTGMSTEVGQIVTMLDKTKEEPTPLQIEIALVGKVLGIAVIVIAVVVMGTIVLLGEVTEPSDLVQVLLLGVSLAVAAVPEGLPAILAVVLAIGVQRMAKRKAVVKKLSSVETLGSASVICTDKTGTLTRNEMMIVSLITASGELEVTGAGYRLEGAVLHEGAPLNGNGAAALLYEAQLVLGAGALASDAELVERDGEWSVLGDPTEGAFLVATHKLDGTIGRIEGFERHGQLPFTSERKLMSTLQSSPDTGEMLVFTKGAPDVLLPRCTRIQVGEKVEPLDDERRAQILTDVARLSSNALRTLAAAYRTTDHDDAIDSMDDAVERDLVWAGFAGIIDPPRSEAAVAIAEAHRAGIRVIMITGDHPLTATRIAHDLGIIDAAGTAMTGQQLDQLDEAGWTEAVRTHTVFARVAPEHKLRIVDALQDAGHIVSMTGDGVNDAPALKSADIGVAMGITGTEVTKEAAKLILVDDNFATIIAAVRQGRAIFDNIKKFLRYLLSSNTGEVLTVFLGVVFAGTLGLTGASPGEVVLPLLATQILWINLVTDTGPALAMGMDPEIDDVMARPPRALTERIIDGRMWGGILSMGVVMAVASLLVMDALLPGGLIPGDGSLEVARTGAFTTLVLTQLFNALNSRSETTSAFVNLLSNRWLWGAIALAFVLQVAVVHVPFLQVAFGTAHLDPAQWLLCLVAASFVLWFDELRKVVLRKRSG